MSRRPRTFAYGLTLASVGLVLLTPGLFGQQGQQAEPDSTRIRILRQLERLSRAPGSDTLSLAGDSLFADSLFTGGQFGPGQGVRPPRRPQRQAPTSLFAAANDSIAEQLLSLTGYTASEYSGLRATFDAKGRELTLEGDSAVLAKVLREGTEVAADSAVIFDQEAGRLRATGASTLNSPSMDPVDAKVLIYDLNESRGSALGARTVSQQGAAWIIRGDINSAEPGLSHIHTGQFTSCNLDIPHYYFQADELKVVAGNVLVARPVKLYFGDVPVLWLPFIAQSVEQGRRSGILTPRFSINDVVQTSGGSRRRLSNVGFFWAVNDYADATFAADWFSGRFFSVSGSGRYRILRQFLEGQLNYRQFWNEDGGQELSFDTRHSWEVSERTRVRMSARFASDNSFVRSNSFDPREVVQSIDSEGGVNHRFDWGTLSLSADRRQFLSDDRVEMTLPTTNLSLRPISLFKAPASQAAWYNNITITGGGRFTRRTQGRELDPMVGFSSSTADKVNTRGALRSSFTLGNFTLSGSGGFNQDLTKEVPFDTIVAPDSMTAGEFVFGDQAESNIDWDTNLSYLLPLMGSTTLTPSVAISGQFKSSDVLAKEIPEASSFVSAPTQVSLNATLKTDIYGFFGGFGPYERIRHKISPSFRYNWAPALDPTDLQTDVFGSREVRRKSQISVTLNQTFEARLGEEEAAQANAEAEAERARAQEALGDTIAGLPGIPTEAILAGDSLAVGDSLAAVGDSLAFLGAPEPFVGSRPGARRQPAGSRPITLLGIRTSAINYDFVEADSTGRFIDGFRTTQLDNQITSDFLRGMRISMTHDLFDMVEDLDTGESRRKFDPFLTRLNFGFSLSAESALFRWLGLFSNGGNPQASRPQPIAPQDQFIQPSGTDESTIVPGDFGTGAQGIRSQPTRLGGAGGWNASFQYSLQRNRDELQEARQQLSINLSLRPTENWDVSWRTSYDIALGTFSDQSVRLSRSIHRWQANFDFLQTVTGNWTFRFEVSLLDNPDIQFDHEQRSLSADQLRRGPSGG